jgi:hypothetical protein
LSDEALVRATFMFLRAAGVRPSANAIVEQIRWARRIDHANGPPTLGPALRRQTVVRLLKDMRRAELAAAPTPLVRPQPARSNLDAQLVAYQAVDALWSVVVDACRQRGTTKSVWKKQNVKHLVAFAQRGMTLEDIVAAHAQACQRAGYVLYSVAQMQRELAKPEVVAPPLRLDPPPHGRYPDEDLDAYTRPSAP